MLILSHFVRYINRNNLFTKQNYQEVDLQRKLINNHLPIPISDDFDFLHNPDIVSVKTL